MYSWKACVVTIHLFHAWTMAFALLIHGVFPSVLTDYASDKMCDHND